MRVSPNDGGTVKVNQGTAEYSIDLTFSTLERVSLEAVPAPGYVFQGWSGALSGTLNPTTLLVDCEKNIVANFRMPATYQLTVQVNGMGSTDPHIGTYSYAQETPVSITAVADKGWRFDGWTGAVSDPASPSVKVTVDADKTVIANFTRILHEVKIQVSGQGTTIPPAGNYPYAEGTAITITAIPSKGWKFTGWTGNVADKQSPYARVTIDGDEVYTANFSEARTSGWLIGGIGVVLAVAIVAWFALRRRT